ncbi:RecQ family zinc-binding domain-containing protein [Deinococcus budaensis]|uniref:ATP-dependent DNA helicase RecQ zinc-binding domain-containing protein n=1 Tax=Deinococcus budaensis TaxID=1665626 RepID=A0A7W8GI12_9DEIO|nr:hypothetical protein [Deinococcus budaensis]
MDADQVGQVLRAVEDQDGPLDLAELQDETGLTRTRILTAVSRLEEVGALEVAPDGEVTVTPGPQDPEVVAQAALAQEHRRSFERSRLEMMRGYAETGACRREYLLNYFGEAYAAPCGACENCLSGRVREAVPENLPFPMGSRVAHATFGEGLVVRYEGEKITVLFDGQGYQTLALGVVLDGGLLEPLGA